MLITIPGRPVPAVRMTQRGKFVKPQAQRYLEYKNTIGWIAKSVCKEQRQGNFRVDMQFILCGGQTPDIDNLAKGMLDGLNKIVWADDKQVCMITAIRIKADKKTDECAIAKITEM